MAYKEETYQQFVESLVNQTRYPVRRPIGDRQYHGDTGFGPDDEDFGHDFSNQDHDDAEFVSSDRTTPGRANSIRHKPLMGFTNRYQDPIDHELAEPSPEDTRNFGGYSTDTGSRHMNPTSVPNVGLEPRVQMAKVKNQIRDLESKLHELQQKKVELMRQITGRL